MKYLVVAIFLYILYFVQGRNLKCRLAYIAFNVKCNIDRLIFCFQEEEMCLWLPSLLALYRICAGFFFFFFFIYPFWSCYLLFAIAVVCINMHACMFNVFPLTSLHNILIVVWRSKAHVVFKHACLFLTNILYTQTQFFLLLF